MKKVLIGALLFSSLFAGGTLAFAQTLTLPSNNAVGQTELNTANPPTNTGTQSNTPLGGNPTGTQGSFVTLSSIPALGTGNGGVPSLQQFLQGLYTICIGIAVVLAILQIIRGGITYMLGESMGTLEEAKHLILVALLGLVLVLSPFIVFSIINPAILQFSLSNDVGGLTSGLSNGSGVSSGVGAQGNTQTTLGGNTVCTEGSGGTCAQVNQNCGQTLLQHGQAADSGHIQNVCLNNGQVDPNGETSGFLSKTFGGQFTCKAGEQTAVHCGS